MHDIGGKPGPRARATAAPFPESTPLDGGEDVFATLEDRQAERLPAGLAGWLHEALRAAAFMPPRPGDLPVPAGLPLLPIALTFGIGIALQRALIPGDASFHLPGLAAGWLSLAGLAWLCWAVAATGRGGGGARLFTLLVFKDLLIAVPMAALYVAAVRLPGTQPPYAWAVYIAWIAWGGLSGLVAAWRLGVAAPAVRAAIVAGFAGLLALEWWGPTATYWYPQVDADETAAAEPEAPKWTQAAIEAQAATTVTQLAAIAPGRPGVVELYAITFAPYADEDVFSREVAMVDEVMRTRFDAERRTLRLQNHVSTIGDRPWATPLNLERAIHAVAQKMNREEDVLLLHLTSHGGKDARLAAGFHPLAVDPVTPTQLRAWLDAAGVRYRVVSISACYSGSWIAPLAEPGTLVMTAADAEHTSYGCGRRSPLTFFGRAMFDEQLRSTTRSFEAAHATARTVIAEREKEAGKDDGYSNPQIAVGAAVRAPLSALQARLEGR